MPQQDSAEKKHSHTHGDDGHAHDHDHSHEHHGHVHTPEEQKAVLNRLSRAIGHMESVKRMVEDGRDCSEVLIQLSAVRSAINNTGKIILQNHIEQCIVEAVKHDEPEKIEELKVAIDKFLK